MPLICADMHAIAEGAVDAGGKARALAQAQLQGFLVPYWFVIPAHAYAGDMGPSEALIQAIKEQLAIQSPERAKTPIRFAVRSSALEEDGAQHSYAGMLESYLHVQAEDIPAAVAAVWASARSEKIAAYCRQHHLPLPDRLPAVIIQEMLEADKSGIAFSADPVTGSRTLVMVSAVAGLANALASGAGTGDSYHITHALEVVQQHIATPSGQPVLNYGEQVSVARLALQAEAIFGAPQDTEWAIAKGRLYLLQSRPITQLPPAPGPDMERWHEWDNAFTVESWPGVNTPLTCDLAQRLMGATYRDQIRLTCISNVPDTHMAPLYRQLVSPLQGRLYLDRQVLETLWTYAPSIVYRLSECWQYVRRFSAATPVKFPERQQAVASPADVLPRLKAALGGLARLISAYWHLPAMVRRFEETVASMLAMPPAMSPQAVRHNLQTVLTLLEYQWQAPCLNTFFTQQLLALLHARGIEASRLHHHPADESDLLSHQFMRRMATLADAVAPHPTLIEAFTRRSSNDVLGLLANYPDIARSLSEFLAQFGDRCQGDLKLESIPWSDDPTPLFRSIAAMAQATRAPYQQQTQADRHAARPGALDRFLLRQYHRCLARREPLRLHLTKAIARLRRLVQQAGAILQGNGVLSAADDIYFLTLDEIDHWLTSSYDAQAMQALQESVNRRKRAYAEHGLLPALPNRFTAWGALLPAGCESSADPAARLSLRGQPCAPGHVTGQVVWYTGDDDLSRYQGKILAATHGDPGLVSLYPVIRGVLLEHGSILSHPAIVARELGLPAIAGLSGLSQWLQDGDSITLNGDSGLLLRESCPEPAP